MSDETVNVLEHLALAYGAAFSRQFGAADPAAVQSAWRKELAGLTPRQVEWGLAHLPVKAPNAVAFRALCIAPRPRPVVGPGAQATPEKAPPGATALASQLGHRGPRGPRQWAVDLQAAEAAGERLSRFQRRCWREALGLPWEHCA